MDTLILRTHGLRNGTYAPASNEIILVFHGLDRDIALHLPSSTWIDLTTALIRLAAKIDAGLTVE